MTFGLTHVVQLQSLIGNKYGEEEITNWLTTEEMEELKRTAFTYDQSYLLADSYVLDQNRVPPAYIIRVCVVKPYAITLLRNILNLK